VPDWLVLGLGLVILGMIYADRRGIADAWRSPASPWSRDRDEAMRSRSPSQPVNLMFGLPLGVAAVIYGTIGLVT
jgi:hypothetical protein